MQATEKNITVSQAAIQDGSVSKHGLRTGNLADQHGMERMNKKQETRRDFKNVTMLACSMILMCSLEGVLSTSAIAFSNGGRAGALYTNLAVWLGFIAVLPLVEGLILFIHVFGFIGIFATLLALSPKASHQAVWNTFYDPGWNNAGLSTLIGGLVAATAPLLGADAAGKSTHSKAQMAEELQDAACTLPRVMTLATFANGLMALVMLIAICYCIGDIEAVLSTPTGYPSIQIFYNITGSLAATNAMTAFIIILSASSCITIMAGSSRQLFAFARDDGLPFSKWVARVRPGLDVPVNAIVVSFTFAACISLVNISSTAAFNSITSLGTGTLTISYIICLSCMIWLRIAGKPLLPSRFDLGRSFGLALDLTAVGFLVLVFVIAFFPPVPEPLLTVVSMNWSILIFGVVVLFSMLYYFLWGRKVYVGPVE
ncbi:hypothetical protein D0859_03188 [Hortaea werneckii]|uniref:Amino acid permease/ SLC12A domain-containing protein n=1 Tax=Hortaea werneckii TaxID=91943 RepID=A0A3M7J4G3_HORWE|nr:hypothetical protein D0859_03188 [Hortaea werneckii]